MNQAMTFVKPLDEVLFWVTSASLLLFALFSTTVCADVVYKREGGKVTGTILPDESTEKVVAIRTKVAGVIKIPRIDIERVEDEDETEAEGQSDNSTRDPTAKPESYEELAEKTPATVNDQLALAKWCLENNRKSDYTKHLQRVLELDPNHAEARRRLGYQLHDGKWLTKKEIADLQGLVEYKGRMVLPQHKEKLEQEKETKQRQSEFYKAGRIWQRYLRGKDKTKQDEATKEMLQVRDPLAIKGLVQVFSGDKSQELERELLLRVLGNIEGDESTIAVLLLVLAEKNETLRDQGIEILVPRKSPQLVKQAANTLRNNDNQKVRNAAMLLADIGDPSIVPQLVDALITKHTYHYTPTYAELAQMSSPGGAVPAFIYVEGPDGSIRRYRNPQLNNLGRSGVGSSPPQRITITEEKRNGEVLDALTKITGQSHGFDKGAWMRWLKSSSREKGVNTKN